MFARKAFKSVKLCCKLYHKTTWFETLFYVAQKLLCNIVANYITKLRGLKQSLKIGAFYAFFVANYITKLRGLKHITAQAVITKPASCKLYHKTTWFETLSSLAYFTTSFAVANYITKLRGLKPQKLKEIDFIMFGCKLYHKTTWFETSIKASFKSLNNGCKLYHKTTWFETQHLNDRLHR